MTFPTTSVLDDFNRTDASSLGSSWTNVVAGWNISGNTARNPQTSTGFSAGLNGSTYGPDCEAFATLSANQTNSSSELWLILRISTFTVAQWDCYVFCLAKSGSSSFWRVDNDAWTQLGSTFSLTPTVGYIGMGGYTNASSETGKFDDFGGGTIVTEISGTLSKTLDNLTKSIAGTVDVTGTTSKTLDNLSKSIAGTVDVTGTTSKTLDDLTKSIAGTVDVTGSAAPTLAGVTLSSAGEITSGISGSLDKTLDDLTKSIAGTVDVTGSAAPTLAGVTLSSAGQTSLTGTLSAVLADISYSLAATVAIDGDLDKTLDGLGISAAGVVGDIESNGTLQATLADLSVSLAGTVAIVGAATPTLADVTSSAAGVIMTGVLGHQVIQDGLMVKSLATNAGLIWIGKHSDDTVSNLTGFELAAGETVTFDWVDNLADIYINQAVESDELCWIKLFV